MELFRLLGTIAINNEGAIKAIDDTTDAAEQSESKLSGAFEKIGGAAVKVGKVVAAGVAAGATAVGALTKGAIDAYADYEQLTGGVETLFKDSAGKVMEYADKAYKTAGLSANAYMETVTSFSASLLQSLDGDTAKAAEKADQAIVDMSDNANKMGSSMESIQNAYQGFAKQNYTMLDNLKLGYGGTKEEMSRLLRDAEAISGIHYDLSSYADVVDAIHVIQTEMGITGTTAKEASTTISGSITSMKASWQNFLVGLSDGNQNMDALVSNLFESVKTVGANLIPRVKQTLKSIWNVVRTEAPKILAEIPTMVMSILPQSVRDFMDEAHDYVIDTVVFGLEAVWESIQNLAGAFSPLIDAVKGFLEPLKDANVQQQINVDIVYFLEEALYRVANVIDIVASVLGTVIQTIVTIGVPAIQAMATVFSTLQAVVTEAIDQYIIPLVQDFVTMIQELLAENQDKINKIGELFTVLGNWISNVIQNVIYPIFQWFIGIVRSSMDNIKKVMQSAFDVIGGIVDFFIALFQGDWQGMWNAIISILTSAVELVRNWFTTMKEFLASIMNSIWSKITEIWENIKLSMLNKLSSIVSTVKQKFTEAKNSVATLFENIRSTIVNKINSAKSSVDSVFNNIKSSIESKINSAKDAVYNAIEKIKGFFDFEWSLPELKLPHIKIDGEWDLKEGKFPSFGVEWYANGAVLNRPTIFGMNGMNAMVGGEAGSEAIAPIDVLQGYVAQAVASQNAGLVESLMKILDALLDMREGMKEDFIEALESMRFDINNREFARLVKAVN